MIEKYVRLDLVVGNWNVCPAIEWRGELEDQANLLEAICLAQPHTTVREYVESFTKAVSLIWPGYAWFLEVEPQDGRWVQVYHPYAFTQYGNRNTQSGYIPCHDIGFVESVAE